MKLTKKDALRIFKDELVANSSSYGAIRGDKIAMCEAWSTFTDMLCKDRMITDSQYRNWSNPF
jgi:hypothetical protein